MRARLLIATGLVAAAVPASAQAAPPVVEATANGNAILGGLSFAPSPITLPVGGVVAWRNTDLAAPHTVTERHGLWDLAGGYLGTPITPPGFGPGTVAERVFEAGTQEYYCRVHPGQMSGTVQVPVTLSAQRTKVKGKLRKRNKKTGKRPPRRIRTISVVSMRWSPETPLPGLGFDVQRRLPGGQWATIQSATRAPTGSFKTKVRRTWEVRARLRAVGGEATTGWSPPASVGT